MTRQQYLNNYESIDAARLCRLLKTINTMIANKYSLIAAIATVRVAFALNNTEVSYLNKYYGIH